MVQLGMLQEICEQPHVRYSALMEAANATCYDFGNNTTHGKGAEGIDRQSLHALSILLFQEVLPKWFPGPFVLCADAFNKWEAGQRLAKKLLVKLYQAANTSDKARPFYRSHIISCTM